MASKFQNRLVGTIVLVALGVIVLPALLDGQKKHYQDEFAAIPLVPKPGDNDEPDMIPATQALPAQPPAGAAEEVRASSAAPAIDSATLPGDGSAGLDALPPGTRQGVNDKPKPRTQTLESQIAKRVEQSAPEQYAPTETKPALAPESKPAAQNKPAQESAPAGKAWVVQLGALKNADKVNEIVGKLRSAGYRAYTSPSTPVQGKITRILVGPDASKDKLKGSLGELKQISGLSGVVMGYSAN
ncbi:cell division protein DedD [Salmonella enterica subsp. enterica serovar Choleraesuis]|nr:cell division protein DedD [Salmonella enterica subsp. enterica serovar Choleraesuis]